jgi:hypothetical protein
MDKFLDGGTIFNKYLKYNWYITQNLRTEIKIREKKIDVLNKYI